MMQERLIGFMPRFKDIEKRGLMNMYVSKAVADGVPPNELEKEIKKAIRAHSRWGKQSGASITHLIVAQSMLKLLAELRHERGLK